MPINRPSPRVITARDVKQIMSPPDGAKRQEQEARQRLAYEQEAQAIVKRQEIYLGWAIIIFLFAYCLCFLVGVSLLEAVLKVSFSGDTRSILRVGLEGYAIAILVFGIRESFGKRFSRWTNTFINSRVLLSSVGAAVSGDGFLLFAVNLAASLVVGLGGWLLASTNLELLLSATSINSHTISAFLSTVTAGSSGGGDGGALLSSVMSASSGVTITFQGALALLAIFLVLGCFVGLVATILGWLTISIFWRAVFKDFITNTVLKFANVGKFSPFNPPSVIRTNAGAAVEAIVSTLTVSFLLYLIILVPKLL